MNKADLQVLRGSKILKGIEVEKLGHHGGVSVVGSGQKLVSEGDPAESFFIVLQGRFTVFSGMRTIAQIGAGEPIGEIAFFAGGARTATVVASRRSRVLEISHSAYREMVRDVPELPTAIIAALAERVVQGNRAVPTFLPRAARIVGLVPATDKPLDEAAVSAITNEMQDHPGWKVLSDSAAVGSLDTEDMLARAETEGRGLLLICHSLANTDWAEMVSDSADALFVLAEAGAGGTPTPSAFERAAWRDRLAPNLHLVLLRQDAGEAIRDTAAWLSERPELTHHHVAKGSTGDFARLARYMTGNALGIVFSGGGAFGAGHLGILKALQEHGFAFDMLGGTSMGSAVAGAISMGLTPERVMDLCDDLFVRQKAMGRYTVPLYSVIEHRKFDDLLKTHYGNHLIEDLPLNFYACATSLTTNRLSVIDQGPLWKAVRASGAIPGILPPMLTADGEVLIDGALVDNAPIETMRSRKPGPNLLLNVHRPGNWRVASNYDQLPGRLGSLATFLGVRRSRFRFPTALSILSRTMIVNAERKINETARQDDVFIAIQPPPGMGFLNWRKARRHFDEAYARASEALRRASGEASSSTEILRMLGQASL